MSDIRIELFQGNYNTRDSLYYVFNYIYKKEYVGGYGFYSDNFQGINYQLQESIDSSSYTNDRTVWHFIISFKRASSKEELLVLANRIAFLFAPSYQIIYGLDTESTNMHLHFGVNAFSYHPDIPTLSKDTLTRYINSIEYILLQNYPQQSITKQLRKKGKHV